MNKYTKYFLTFSQGEWVDAGARLGNQVSILKLFDIIDVINNEIDHYNIMDLLSNYSQHIADNARGHGLWFWKPYLCLAVMNRMNEGDVLFYADSGCEVTEEGRQWLSAFIDSAHARGSIFFSLPLAEKFWTKKALVDLFSKERALIGEERQVQATFFILRKDHKTLNLIRAWKKLCFMNNFLALREGCDEGSGVFHRHDQSILSLLVKNRGMNIYPFDFHVPFKFYFKKSLSLYLPIHPLRNRNKDSVIQAHDEKFKFIKNTQFVFFILKMHIRIYLSRFYIGRQLVRTLARLKNSKEI